MRTYAKWGIGFFLTCSLLFVGTNANATVTSKIEQKSERTTKKQHKQQDRVHKKIRKIQNRIIKAKEKAGAPVLDDAGFLEGADDRVRWGLIGVAGGILLGIILAPGFKFLGWLALVAGLGLLVWYLIEP